MAFLEYNDINADGRDVLYVDFPFVFKPNTRQCYLRQRGFAIGRMYYVPPTAGEKHFLRLLLTVVRCPRSIEHLRTVNGIVHPNFRAACIAAGLLDNDRPWISCFEDASFWQTGYEVCYSCYRRRPGQRTVVPAGWC
jgi:hypothetical protein